MSEYIYILINPAIPNLVKIGRTDRSPENRASELATTGVPTAFIVAYEHQVANSRGAESAIHALLQEKGFRPEASREFFKIPLKTAVAVVSEICVAYEGETSEDEYSSSLNSNSLGAAQEYFWKGFEAYHGDGDELQSYSKALEYLEISHKLGDLSASDLIANIYLWGLAGRKMPEKAISILQQAGSAGDPDAFLKLARIFLGLERSPEGGEDSSFMLNLPNAVKCYQMFFASDLTFDARVEGLVMVIDVHKLLYKEVYPGNNPWSFLDTELRSAANIARGLLQDVNQTRDERERPRMGNFLLIVNSIRDKIDFKLRVELLTTVFRGFDSSSLKYALKNLPDRSVDDYVSSYSRYMFTPS